MVLASSKKKFGQKKAWVGKKNKAGKNAILKKFASRNRGSDPFKTAQGISKKFMSGLRVGGPGVMGMEGSGAGNSEPPSGMTI